MRQYIYVLIYSLALTGCSPELGAKTTPLLFPIDSKVPVAAGTEIPFRDLRVEREKGPGRSQPGEDAPHIAGRALAERLRLAGYVQPPGIKPYLYGEILEWNVEVFPKFPMSGAEAKSQVRLTIADNSGGRRDFIFSGEARTEHVFLTKFAAREILGRAMSEALDAAAKDEQFLSLLDQISRSAPVPLKD